MGLNTNVAFLRRVVGSQAFATADLDTALIERERPALFEAPPLPWRWPPPPWWRTDWRTRPRWKMPTPGQRRDGWRLHGGAQRQLEPEGAWPGAHAAGGPPARRRHGAADRQPALALQRTPLGAGRPRPDIWAGRLTATVYRHGERFAVFTAQGSALVQEFDPIAHAGDGAGEGGRLTAPMPGKVIAFLALPGEHVSAARRWP
jgi:3-methylcrotonyl-CoA carboxylase alpha subunit